MGAEDASWTLVQAGGSGGGPGRDPRRGGRKRAAGCRGGFQGRHARLDRAGDRAARVQGQEGVIMSTVTSMMRGLEKALARAPLADDRELAGKVREEGRRLVFLLNGLIRMTRMYDPENAAFDSPSRDLVGALRGLIELLGAVHVICVEDQIYVNDIRLRLGISEQTVA